MSESEEDLLDATAEAVVASDASDEEAGPHYEHDIEDDEDEEDDDDDDDKGNDGDDDDDDEGDDNNDENDISVENDHDDNENQAAHDTENGGFSESHDDNENQTAHDNENGDFDESMEEVAAAEPVVEDPSEEVPAEIIPEAEVVAVPVDDDNDNNDEEEEEEQVAMEVDETVDNQPSSNKSKKPIPKSSSSNANMKKSSSNTTKKKRKKSSRAKNAAGDSLGISGDRLMAADAARSMLQNVVHKLPFQIQDQYIIRNLGKLRLNHDAFATSSSLFAVGFSCDRYEFSPVHGRVLKLRCEILDGTNTNLDYKGPIFRIMWGPGVDEDIDKVKYPYNPYANSAPLTDRDEVVAVTVTSDKQLNKRPAPLSSGMRVKVRFDKNKYFLGAIEKVEKPKDEGKKKRSSKTVKISVRYDDGSMEDLQFPDPDVSLVMPGTGNETDGDGSPILSFINRKPVTSAIGKTPLEAWSQCLLTLGMIDEVILDQAMNAMKTTEVANSKSTRREKKDLREKVTEEKTSHSTIEKQDNDSKADMTMEQTQNGESDREPISEEEQKLRDEIDAIRKELGAVKTDDEIAVDDLANARIELLGKLFINPFGTSESDRSHQASWIAAAVRKEKSRMGSTGNRRKVVTATDLLQRNDTFYNAEVEALLEGLPGSEYCTEYKYQASRGAVAASSKWIQEQKTQFEREKKRKAKASKEAKAKASQQKEKEMKRKRREDERDARKRMKLEEEEGKKKVRTEDRMKKLKAAVDDKLFKEATFQREKVVLLLAKNMNREFARRRKVAEMLSRDNLDTKQIAKIPTQALPQLATQYDEDIIRIWDFIATFGDFFVKREYMSKQPSLDDLQTAIDTLRGIQTKMNKAQATGFVTELAVSLCKPLSADITRMLFASLIALNPVLQKDFGAAFFNEVNSTELLNEATIGEEKVSLKDILLPVDSFTWKEIARIAFESDALGEIGFARQDAAHVLRGYRSAGHPNSKEARRIRRVEDHYIALLRQMLKEGGLVKRSQTKTENTVRLDVPTKNTCNSSSWLFYLHNINSMTPPLMSDVLSANIDGAAKALRNIGETGSEELLQRLEGLRDESKSITDSKDLIQIQSSIVTILEKATGEKFSGDTYGERIKKEEHHFANQADVAALKKATDSRSYRSRMGELETLTLTNSELKFLTRNREKYMADALLLKEEMKRQELKEAGEDIDDDDDDEEEEQVKDKDLKEKTVGAESNESKDDDTHDEIMGDSTVLQKQGNKIGKETPYDDFCEDIPEAPELIRRCLAVVRALSMSGPSEPFLYPVDPQSNPGYYDMLLQPMCMREVGVQLQRAGKKCIDMEDAKKNVFIEETVAEFASNVRLIGRNCLCYANAGPMIIAAGGEMLRIFERLLLDWVLAPEKDLAPLELLDDDLCVNPHPSDAESTVLLCDGCEGNFNIARLDPPLRDIPKGDWYCPRCISGRWWGDLDPRVNKRVSLRSMGGLNGIVKRCVFAHKEGDDSPSLLYEVMLDSGAFEWASLSEIDDALRDAGTPCPKIRCLKAVAESKGYGAGVQNGLRHDIAPVLLHPKVSDAASQVAPSSTVFRDLVASACTLLINDPQEMTANEWLRLLALLVMKCSSSDIMQNVASQMEEQAAERLARRLEEIQKTTDHISDILPKINDNGDTLCDDKIVEVEASPLENITQMQPVKADTDTGVLIEASAVEVPIPDGNESRPEIAASAAGTTSHSGDEEEFKKFRSSSLAERSKRQKAREESIVGFCIKNQIRSTVSSFEQDNVSQVIENAFAAKNSILSFASTRCRHVPCEFCNLLDTSLGTNLVRIPNADEWNELIKFGARSLRTNMIAEHADSSHKYEKFGGMKMMSVTVRVGEELVPDEKSELTFNQTPDGGMLEFMPRNSDAFQEELRFRYENSLPFVTGSRIGHDCCAAAVHNARKVQIIQDFKERQSALAEQEEGNKCGRTLQICNDAAGRSYWSLNSESDSLFVYSGECRWSKYSEPETIASVIISLEKDPAAKELLRVFPQAKQLIESGLWKDMLQRRRFKLNAIKQENDDSSAAMEIENTSEVDDVFEEKESVLVDSQDGLQLWDATVKAVANNDEGIVTGYRVHYEGWGSRFDEWVSANRVVEPNEHNREVQEQLKKECAESQFGLPMALSELKAASYLYAKDRARGSRELLDFAKIANVPPSASEDERIFATMKAAILAIEAALPLGCVNHLDSGAWSPRSSGQWRTMVQQAEGSWDLMRCIILFEDVISEDWMKEHIGHLRTCLPSRWKALEDASPSSLSLRIFLLDRALMYNTVDKRKYRSRTKK